MLNLKNPALHGFVALFLICVAAPAAAEDYDSFEAKASEVKVDTTDVGPIHLYNVRAYGKSRESNIGTDRTRSKQVHDAVELAKKADSPVYFEKAKGALNPRAWGGQYLVNVDLTDAMARKKLGTPHASVATPPPASSTTTTGKAEASGAQSAISEPQAKSRGLSP